MVSEMKVTPDNMTAADQGRIFEVVKKAAGDFEGLGIAAISSACNLEREALLARACTEPFLEQQGSRFDAPTVRTELEKPFALQPLPDELVIDFALSTCEKAPACPMTAPTEPGNRVWIHMDANDAEKAWGPTVGVSVEDIMLHELLHICGEREYDGTIRYNWAGVSVIRRLIEQAAPPA